ncbi:MAG: S16 family serine protease [Methanothrix sp.]
MGMQNRAMLLAILPILLATMSFAGFAGNATIHAPAVILQTNNGTLTIIKLNVTTGTGIVNITGPLSVGQSTINSSEAAAIVASSKLGLNYKNYNFHYQINDNFANVSGPSAGTAMTLLALSALSHKSLLDNFTVTGVINYNGTIGEIGGVYDKIEAAKARGMSFIMVPFAGNNSLETEIYYLASRYFGMRVIPINNVSQAFLYATGSVPVSGLNVSFNVSDNYNISGIPQANLSCSNQCNQTALAELASFTLNFTNASISNVSAFSRFAPIARNLSINALEASQLAQKGYYYTSADVAFIDFINSFMFQNPNLSISRGQALLNSVSYYCSSLNPPPLTRSNYNDVLNGELRQLWGNVTINALLSQYNSTAIDSDGVLRNVYSAAEAYAWCKAASQIYSESSPSGSYQAVNVSNQLKPVAQLAISSALSSPSSSSVPSVYIIGAKVALDQGNYALALLDSDYMVSDEHSIPSNVSEGGIYNATASLINSSRFGAWATQFADEALFYMNESSLVSPQRSASMLSSGYYAALLGSEISNSTKEIYGMLTTTPVSKPSTTQPSSPSHALPSTINIIIILLLIIIALLLATLVVAFITLSELRNELRGGNQRGKRAR